MSKIPLPILMPGAEPFFFRGDGVGCLLLHGLTASPQEMRPLAEFLAMRGHTVYAPRLPYHGTTPIDLPRAVWGDWFLAALDAYYVLVSQCDKIVVGGLSMGGLTALLLSAVAPVSGVISLSTPIDLSANSRLRMARVLWRMYPYFKKPNVGDAAVDPLWRGRYPVHPLRSLAELVDYMAAVRPFLPQIKVPTLLVHAQDDESAPISNLHILTNEIGTTPIVAEFRDGGHVLTFGKHAHEINELVFNFINYCLDMNVPA